VRIDGGDGIGRRLTSRREWWIFYSAAVAALVVLGWHARVHWLRMHPIDQVPDMHRVIAAGVRLLLDGRFPYRPVDVPWWVPMGYQPGMFLPYVPAGVLGIDTRHAAVIGSVAAPLIWLVWFRPRNSYSMIVVPVVSALWLFNKLQTDLPANVQTPTWWPWCALGSLSFLSGRWKTSGVFWGLAAASRQQAAGAAAALAIYLVRRVGWRAAGGFAAAGTIAAVLLYAPFLAIDARAVLIAPMQNYRAMVEHVVIGQNPSWIRESMGLGVWLIRVPHYLDWMLWAQTGAMAVVWAITALRVRTARSAVVAAGVCLLFFNYFLHWAVWYLYAEPFIIFACAGLQGLFPSLTVGPPRSVAEPGNAEARP
jgi:hypothetical protein